MAWILGEWGFHKYDFIVTPGVLCPRRLRKRWLESFFNIPKEPTNDKPWIVADIGCGSGCIGLTIALERPHVRVFSVDIADEAYRMHKSKCRKTRFTR